jgi:hypothetical protein
VMPVVWFESHAFDHTSGSQAYLATCPLPVRILVWHGRLFILGLGTAIESSPRNFGAFDCSELRHAIHFIMDHLFGFYVWSCRIFSICESDVCEAFGLMPASLWHPRRQFWEPFLVTPSTPPTPRTTHITDMQRSGKVMGSGPVSMSSVCRRSFYIAVVGVCRLVALE